MNFSRSNNQHYPIILEIAGKYKMIITIFICMSTILTSQAQILKNLKEKLTGGTSAKAEVNIANQKNTAAKRAFYIEDVVVETYDKEKQARTINCFDANEIAMQSNWTDKETGKPKTLYIDSEGYYISFDENENGFMKTNLLSSGAIGMVGPTIMAQAYKLPTGVIWEASETLNNNGLNLNTFMFLEFAFILKPEHFTDEMYMDDYNETKVTCRGFANCTKFNIEDPEYSDSYILFDSTNRLAEINITTMDHQQFGSNSGKLEYFYKSCNVKLPAAKEKKMPGQDLFNMGLNPNKD